MPDTADTTITVRLHWEDRSLFAGAVYVGRLYCTTHDTRVEHWGFASLIQGICVLGLHESREDAESAAMHSALTALRG